MTNRNTRKILKEIIETYRNIERNRHNLYSKYRDANNLKRAIIASTNHRQLSRLNASEIDVKKDIDELEAHGDDMENHQLKQLVSEYEDVHYAELANLRGKLRKY